MSATKPTGYVIYRGPSSLDGAPIVAIAITSSSNRKTGNMVQTYILREDLSPLEAIRNGADASICGDCKHRPILGGACYVRVDQGPLVVWKALKRGRYPAALTLADPSDAADHDRLPYAWYQAVASLGDGRMVRLGTYGDPMAVPPHVWEALVSRAQGVTGYTHQWANAAIPAEVRSRITGLCMASVDTPDEALAARAQGFRYFRIRTADEALAAREFVCPASEEAGKRKTCADCGACDGSARKPNAGSPVIIAHGSKASRYITIRSV